MSHLWFHNDKLAQRILDPMTFEYLLDKYKTLNALSLHGTSYE